MAPLYDRPDDASGMDTLGAFSGVRMNPAIVAGWQPSNNIEIGNSDPALSSPYDTEIQLQRYLRQPTLDSVSPDSLAGRAGYNDIATAADKPMIADAPEIDDVIDDLQNSWGQTAGSYASGGMVRSFDDGGINTDPNYAPQGPNQPTDQSGQVGQGELTDDQLRQMGYDIQGDVAISRNNTPSGGANVRPRRELTDDEVRRLGYDINGDVATRREVSGGRAAALGLASGLAPAIAAVPGWSIGSTIGAGIGTAGGPIGIGAGYLLGGFAGAGFAAYGAKKVGDAALVAAGITDEQELAAARQQHPYISEATEIAPNILTMGGLGARTAARLTNAVIGGGMEAGQEYATEGKFDPAKVAIAAGGGSLFPGQTRLGRALDVMGSSDAYNLRQRLGKVAGDKVAGRPGVTATNADAAAAADVTRSPPLRVGRGVAFEQPAVHQRTPPPAGEASLEPGATIDVVRSSRDGLKPTAKAPGATIPEEGTFGPSEAETLALRASLGQDRSPWPQGPGPGRFQNVPFGARGQPPQPGGELTTISQMVPHEDLGYPDQGDRLGPAPMRSLAPDQEGGAIRVPGEPTGPTEAWTQPAGREVYQHPQLPGITINRTRAVQDVTGISRDGKTIYVDKSVPSTVEINGKPLDPAVPATYYDLMARRRLLDAAWRKKVLGHDNAPTTEERDRLVAAAHADAGKLENAWLQRHGYDPVAYEEAWNALGANRADGHQPGDLFPMPAAPAVSHAQQPTAELLPAQPQAGGEPTPPPVPAPRPSDNAGRAPGQEEGIINAPSMQRPARSPTTAETLASRAQQGKGTMLRTAGEGAPAVADVLRAGQQTEAGARVLPRVPVGTPVQPEGITNAQKLLKEYGERPTGPGGNAVASKAVGRVQNEALDVSDTIYDKFGKPRPFESDGQTRDRLAQALRDARRANGGEYPFETFKGGTTPPRSLVWLQAAHDVMETPRADMEAFRHDEHALFMNDPELTQAVHQSDRNPAGETFAAREEDAAETAANRRNVEEFVAAPESETGEAMTPEEVSQALAQPGTREVRQPGQTAGTTFQQVKAQEDALQQRLATQRAAREAQAAPKMAGLIDDQSGNLNYNKLVADAKSWMKPITDAVRAVFSPQTISEGSRRMGAQLREFTGTTTRQYEVVKKAMEKFRDNISQLTPEEQRAVVNYIENRGKGAPRLADPIQQQFADEFRGVMQDVRAQMEALPDRDIQSFIDDYFPHMWKDKDAAESAMRGFGGGRMGSGASLKQRSIPTMEDGYAKGLKPVTEDPVEALLRYHQSMTRYLAMVKLRDANVSDGTFQWGRAKGVGASGNPEGFQSGAPEGFTALNGPGTRTPDGRQLYAPTPVARVYNNFASPGWGKNADFGSIMDAAQRGSNAVTALELGFSGYHAVTMTFEGMVSQVAQGLSRLASGDIAGGMRDIAASPTAPYRLYQMGKQIERDYLGLTPQSQFSTNNDILAAAGARMTGSRHAPEYQYTTGNNWVEVYNRGQAAGGKGLASVAQDLKNSFARLGTQPVQGAYQLLMKSLATFAHPIFNAYVPRLKNGAMHSLLSAYMERNPDATREEVQVMARKIVDTVDDRFGELVQDNIFWNKTMKQVSTLMQRSYSWNYGTARTIGGGFFRAMRDPRTLSISHPDHDPRVAYVAALPLVVGTMNAVYQKLLGSGDAPQSPYDLVAGRTGGVARGWGGKGAVPERIMMPGYQKDVLGWTTDPLQEATNKIARAPTTAWQLLWNKDYRGNPIHDWHHGAFDQASEIGKYLSTAIQPISAKNAFQNRQAGTAINPVSTALGARPAPVYIQDPQGYKRGNRLIAQRDWNKKVRQDLKDQARSIPVTR